MKVLDASAVLAYLTAELGADVVDRELDGAVISAANWSEVVAKLGAGIEGTLADAILVARGVTVEPVVKQDAHVAARLGERKPQLSLGDRLCLALAERLDATALTADKAWGSGSGITQIR